MKNIFKKAISVLLITVMVLCSAPLSGFVGLELPEIGGLGKLADSVSDFFADLAPKAKAVTDSGTCGENLTWTFDESTGELEISGTGEMRYWSWTNGVPWHGYRNSVKSVTLPDGLTNIGNYAFRDCNGLTSVTIPDSVTSIGSSAFKDCSSLASVTIPDSVTSIGNSAFENCDSLTSITIPDSVTSIGYYAFSGCDSLASVTIPDSVTSIGSSVFSGCDSLASITIPDSVTSIGDYAFSGCDSLASITIPDSVTSIDNSAFYSCDSLASVTIGNSVTSIGDYAFEDCTSLASITIPDSVTSIGNYAFYECTSLTSITADSANTSYSSDEHGVLFNKDKTELIQYPIGNTRTSYVIPDSVTNIGDYAFHACAGIENLSIGNCVRDIGKKAFAYCEILTNITIPDSVTSIGSYAFQYCDSLASIKIGNGIKSIGVSAFSYTPVENNSENWENDVWYIGNYLIRAKQTLSGTYSVKEGTKVIADNSFDYCSDLTNVTIPDSVVYIGHNAFVNTAIYNDSSNWENDVLYIGNHLISAKSNVSGSYEIKNGTVSVSGYAFNSCNSLNEIIIPETVVAIGSDIINSNNYNQSKYIGTYEQWKNVYVNPHNRHLLDCVIYGYGSESSTVGGACGQNLTWVYNQDKKEVVIDGYGEMYDNYTRWQACEIESVYLHNGATSIGSYTFRGCSGLTSVIIPDSVTSIGSYAFYSCDSLENVYYTGDLAGWCGIDFDGYGSNPMCYADNLYINGSLLEGDIVIPDGITSIGNYTFYGCSGITSVIIPDSVTSIGGYAFAYCSSLASITIPDSVTSISDSAFDNCMSLKNVYYTGDLAGWCGIDFDGWHSNPMCYADNLYINGSLLEGDIVIPDGITSIGNYTFYGCSGLTSITIPDSVTSIGEDAFYNCDSLASVTIGNSVTSIGDSAFDNCMRLKNVYYTGDLAGWCGIYFDVWYSNPMCYADNLYINGSLLEGDIVIPDRITSIGNDTFYGCSGITSVIIPDSVTSIGSSAFSGCDSLASITIPDSVTSIGNYAFSGCSNLERIVLGECSAEIDPDIFEDCDSLEFFEVSADNPNYSSDESGVLYNKDKSSMLVYPSGKKDECFEIPAFISEINPSAFKNNKNLRTLTVNENNKSFTAVDGVIFSKDSKTLIYYPSFKSDEFYIIPDSVTTIASHAIYKEYDTSLKYLIIPETVETFCEQAVYTSSSFSAIYFGGTQEEWNNLRSQNNSYISYSEIFYETSVEADPCGLLYYIDENSGAVIIMNCSEEKGDFVIPPTLGGYPVTEIGDSVFYENDNITSITIPDTVTYIGEKAFYLCTGLEKISLPENLKEIGEWAFYGCINLETVEIPSGLETIGEAAFTDCIELTHFTVAEGNEIFTVDENGVLYWYVSDYGETVLVQYPANSPVEHFVIPDYVTFVYPLAFQNARNLRTLTIPASVREFMVDIDIFGKSIEKFIVDENNPILSSDEQGALYDKDKTTLIYCPPAMADKTFVIPDSVTSVVLTAFMFCDEISITIPDTLVSIVNCSGFLNVKEFIVSETHPELSSHKGALYNKDKTVLIRYPMGSDADIHVAPDTLREIYDVGLCPFSISYYSDICLPATSYLYDENTNLIDNLTLHLPSMVEFGEMMNNPVKHICIENAEDEEIRLMNQELSEYKEAVQEYIQELEQMIENGEMDKEDEMMCQSMLPVYKKWIETSSDITHCAGDHSDVHVHKWDETVVEETCTSDGSITRVCSLCDEVSVEVIPASHKPGEWVTVTEPTTRTEGKKVKYCTVCNETVEEEIIPKLYEPVTGIELKETEILLENYSSAQLTAKTVPEDASNGNILWSSSDESVATVDENGVVTAVSVGNAIITATTEEGGFTAECEVTVVPAKFTVTLNVNGVQSVVTYDEGAWVSIKDPVREGYSFVKWIPAIPDVMPSENIESTAVFEINSYTVEWNIEGFSMTETYEYGEKIDKSKTFTKKGYTFAGWTPEVPETMPANDLVFNATWTANLYDAVFFTNGGSFPDGDSIKRIPTAYNSVISVPENPVRAGYEFMGWAYNGRNIGTNAGIMDSVDGKEFEAIWASNNTSRYKIETYTMNTVGGYDKSSVTLNGNVHESVSLTPEVETGFVLNEEKSILEGTVNADNSLVLKVYYDRLSFNFNMVIDGVTETVSYYYGAMISEPAIPVKEGYEFVGWDKEIPVTMPAEDITVTAVFKEKAEEKTYAKLTIAKPEKSTIYYGESIMLYASVKNAPEGAKIKWYVDGDGVSIKPSANGKTCKVTSTSNGNVVVRATLVDAKGNTIKGSDGKPVADYEPLYSEVTFWQIIVNFFRNLFKGSDSASQAFRIIF